MNNKPKPLSHEELMKLRKPVKNVNIEHRETLTRLEKLAVWITAKVGSMGSFYNNLYMDNPMAWLEYNSSQGLTV